ncbi:nuclear pore complex interacting protein family member A7, partial [Homo sapiens]
KWEIGYERNTHLHGNVSTCASVAAAGRGLLQMQNHPFCKKASLQPVHLQFGITWE